jgi:hypothetical protein
MTELASPASLGGRAAEIQQKLFGEQAQFSNASGAKEAREKIMAEIQPGDLDTLRQALGARLAQAPESEKPADLAELAYLNIPKIDPTLANRQQFFATFQQMGEALRRDQQNAMRLAQNESVDQTAHVGDANWLGKLVNSKMNPSVLAMADDIRPTLQSMNLPLPSTELGFATQVLKLWQNR